MAHWRSALRSRVGLLASAAVSVLAAGPAGAVPTTCPSDAGTSTCEVTVGNTTVIVEAGDEYLAVFSWTIAGVEQLYLEQFPILDVLAIPQKGFDLLFASATADDATATIEAQFMEAQGIFHETATFTLTATPDGAVLDESIALDSLTKTRATRLYAVTDFDLDGTSLDESIQASAGGGLIVQTDGSVTAVSEAGNPPPDAFQVAKSATLADLGSGTTFFPLDGTASVPGFDDFAFAVSWDRTLGSGDALSVALRRQITVPEPTLAACAAASVLTLLALRARR